LFIDAIEEKAQMSRGDINAALLLIVMLGILGSLLITIYWMIN